jgi:hypothetical protein
MIDTPDGLPEVGKKSSVDKTSDPHATLRQCNQAKPHSTFSQFNILNKESFY